MRLLLTLIVCASSACAERPLGFTGPEPFDAGPPSQEDLAAARDLADATHPHRDLSPDLSLHVGGPRTPRFDLTGTFGAAHLVLAGDLDLDGHVDLVTLGPASSTDTWTVSTWLGDGAGAFIAQPAIIAIGSYISGARLVDLDGDGHLDLIAADVGTSELVICHGVKAGFGPPQTIAVTGAGGITDVEAADLDGDGVTDLVVIGQDDAAHVFRGQSAAAPLPAGSMAVGYAPAGVRAIDFDLNGTLDLVTVNRYGGDVSFLAGDGHLGFAAAAHFDAGYYPSSLVVGDLDGDGVPDIAVQDEISLGSIVPVGASVLYGDGFGRVRATTTIQFASSSAFVNWLAAGDFDGDGRPDLIGGNPDQAPTTLVLSSNGAEILVSADVASWAGAIGDFDGDGWPDLALATAGGVRVYLNRAGP